MTSAGERLAMAASDGLRTAWLLFVDATLTCFAKVSRAMFLKPLPATESGRTVLSTWHRTYLDRCHQGHNSSRWCGVNRENSAKGITDISLAHGTQSNAALSARMHTEVIASLDVYQECPVTQHVCQVVPITWWPTSCWRPKICLAGYLRSP